MPRFPFDDDDASNTPPHNHARAAAHPGSAFARLRAERQHGQPPQASAPGQQHLGREQQTASMASNTTPGADNFGQQAAGGIAGIALGVADHRPRESGMRSIPGSGVDGRPLPYENPQGYAQQGFGQRRGDAGPVENPAARPAYTAYNSRDYSNEGYNQQYDSRDRSTYDGGVQRPPPRQEYSQGSQVPLVAVSMADSPFRDGPYRDGPYDSQASHRYSQRIDPSWQLSDPNTIADDGDDGLEYTSHNRGSMLSVGRSSDRLSTSTATGGAAAGGAAAGGIMSSLGGLVGRTGSGSADGAQLYGRVENPQASAAGSDIAGIAGLREKSEWLSAERSTRKKRMWIVAAIMAVIILGAVGGGVAGALLSNKSHDASSASTSSSGSGGSAASDAKDNGDLSKDSAEIKALLNNADLRKVFPGMDYTPMYTQYPGCLTYPPSQNNITRDVAVLSQLTNVVRLYGTDCNQTEMVLHAIDRLGLNGTMKVWLGVWQDGNATTDARQLRQMYAVLDAAGTAPFVGAIVGNEVLVREEMTVAQLSTLVGAVKTNFTALGYDLPVATSDIGAMWTQALADAVDVLMSNVHPFFTGKPVAEAAEFTWQFWQNQNWPLKPDARTNYIAETGWPSKGGTDCGIGATAPCAGGGSVAGVEGMNRFMEDWVCPALKNGTRYFWFEAFDEPWKIKFNEAGKEWEDQWGLMDVDRRLKTGVKIPDCGGVRVGDA